MENLLFPGDGSRVGAKDLMLIKKCSMCIQRDLQLEMAEFAMIQQLDYCNGMLCSKLQCLETL